jgi:transposase
VGYVFAIRSERLICREVQVNLAYRWFCKLGIEDAIPDHSAFSRARNERFRSSRLLQQNRHKTDMLGAAAKVHCRG